MSLPDHVPTDMPESHRSAPVLLAHDDTIRVAAGRIVTILRDHLAANVPVAIDGRNAEGVHQVRVALRRFRVLTRLLRRDNPNVVLEGVSAHAKVLAKAVGDARNWDVLLMTTLPNLQPLGLMDLDATKTLAPRAEPMRRSAYAQARQALTGQDAAQLQTILDQMVEGELWVAPLAAMAQDSLQEPAIDFSARHLERLHRKALRAGRDFALLPPQDRHRLRVALKKLRYTAEFFRGLYADSDQTKDFIKKLSALQDVLGMDSDVLTTRYLLARLGEGAEDDARLQHMLGAVTGFLCGHQIAVHRDAHLRWRKFRRHRTFWSR
ncbi:CHAD domain-containing protein [Nguyenibacter vanlangensis]|uniref:CHAD domain-containing protein n=1 Tax=Nguyenibacter vanlangensis TaxID=1216886 RepID=UPI001C3FF820|nr:CHAD domain-containing protein [Nguyenibacter vanlangensis]